MEHAAYQPSLEEARTLAGKGNLLPVFREVTADLETPVSAYLKVARGQHSFLLESVEGGERLARYSFIGTEPYRVLRSPPGSASDPLREIERELGRFSVGAAAGSAAVPRRRGRLPGVRGGAPLRAAAFARRRPAGAAGVGLHVHRHAPRLRPPPAQDQGGQPRPPRRRRRRGLPSGDLARSMSWRSGWRSRSRLTPANGAAEIAGGEGEMSSNVRREEFSGRSSGRSEYIIAGDIIQVVLSQRLSRRRTPARSSSTARCARSTRRRTCTTCGCGDFHIVGSSPEMLVRVEEGIGHDASHRRARGRRGRDAGGGRGAGGGAARRREGARRAHHARRPRAQRHRAGERARARVEVDAAAWRSSATRT